MRFLDVSSLMPARYFVEHWWTWVAVERWPALAARLRDCERIVAESAYRSEDSGSGRPGSNRHDQLGRLRIADL
jgi:hypothetical protein